MTSIRMPHGPAMITRIMIAGTMIAVALVLMTSACGAGPAAVGHAGTPSAGSNSASAVAYSACMRSHGIVNFPDPGSAGQLPKADPHQLGVSTTRYQAAQRSCQHLIPANGDTAEQQQELQCATGGDCSQAVITKWMDGLRTMAGCLRTHGEPSWPDPIIGPGGTPHYPYEQAGIDHHSAKVLGEVDRCTRLTGFEGLPLP